MSMLTPTPVLLAAAAALPLLQRDGAVISGVETNPAGFRAEGVRDGKRVVVLVSFSIEPGHVAVSIERAVGRSSSPRKRATGRDHTAAVVAALA